MTDNAVQFSEGTGGKYALMETGPTVGGHPTYIPRHILYSPAAITGALATVVTAGVRVQLPSHPCQEVTIIARRLNTGYIYVGGSTVSSSAYGAELQARGSIVLRVNNSNLIYIDASVSGEGVSYFAI